MLFCGVSEMKMGVESVMYLLSSDTTSAMIVQIMETATEEPPPNRRKILLAQYHSMAMEWLNHPKIESYD